MKRPAFPIRSVVDMDESVANRERKFGSTDRYFPVWVCDCGQWQPALLTRDQIESAILRAKGNPEDVPPRRRGLLDRLLGL